MCRSPRNVFELQITGGRVGLESKEMVGRTVVPDIERLPPRTALALGEALTGRQVERDLSLVNVEDASNRRASEFIVGVIVAVQQFRK